MNKLNKTLSEVLDVEPIDYQTTEIVQVKTPVEDDAEFARTNIRDLISKGNTAIDNLLQVATASEHPRAYEVAGQLIKNVADVTDKLADLHKKMKDLNDDYQGPKSITNNALYVGSTADLLQLIKQEKKMPSAE